MQDDPLSVNDAGAAREPVWLALKPTSTVPAAGIEPFHAWLVTVT